MAMEGSLIVVFLALYSPVSTLLPAVTHCTLLLLLAAFVSRLKNGAASDSHVILNE